MPISDEEANISSITRPGFLDKNVKYTDVWKMLLVKAAYARADHRIREFIFTIDSLVSLLYKDLRQDVINFAGTLPESENKLDNYIDIEEFIIDLLERKQYLGSKKTTKRGSETEIERGSEE